MEGRFVKEPGSAFLAGRVLVLSTIATAASLSCLKIIKEKVRKKTEREEMEKDRQGAIGHTFRNRQEAREFLEERAGALQDTKGEETGRWNKTHIGQNSLKVNFRQYLLTRALAHPVYPVS